MCAKSCPKRPRDLHLLVMVPIDALVLFTPRDANRWNPRGPGVQHHAGCGWPRCQSISPRWA
eukprot:6672156-Alexandrium_andersonii.AAC.1